MWNVGEWGGRIGRCLVTIAWKVCFTAVWWIWVSGRSCENMWAYARNWKLIVVVFVKQARPFISSYKREVYLTEFRTWLRFKDWKFKVQLTLYSLSLSLSTASRRLSLLVEKKENLWCRIPLWTWSASTVTHCSVSDESVRCVCVFYQADKDRIQHIRTDTAACPKNLIVTVRGYEHYYYNDSHHASVLSVSETRFSKENSISTPTGICC